MRIIQDTTTLNIAIDSLEGGVITVSNVGGSDITGITISITVEDVGGNTIDAANWSLVNETLSQGVLAGETWTVGDIDSGNSATADFDLQIDTEANFPSRFILKATYGAGDDDSTNDIASRTFDVIKCSDIVDCLP